MSSLVVVRAQELNIWTGYSKYLVSPVIAHKIMQTVKRQYSSCQRRDYKSQHDKHFNGQIGICSSIIYCRCDKHETMAVLFVKPEHSNKYVLPGGRRDKAGEGRAKYSKYDETCWQAIQGEFLEEVGEPITNYCPQPCPFFTTAIHKSKPTTAFSISAASNFSGDHRVLSNESSRQDEQDSQDVSALRMNADQPMRNIRTYYFEVTCGQLPDKEYGRFRLYETTARLWISLEDIVRQFKFTYYSNRFTMSISPFMFQTFKHFAGIVINQIRLKSVADVEAKLKSFKTIRMLEQLISSNAKTKLPSQIPFHIDDTHNTIVITDFLIQ